MSDLGQLIAGVQSMFDKLPVAPPDLGFCVTKRTLEMIGHDLSVFAIPDHAHVYIDRVTDNFIVLNRCSIPAESEFEWKSIEIQRGSLV